MASSPPSSTPLATPLATPLPTPLPTPLSTPLSADAASGVTSTDLAPPVAAIHEAEALLADVALLNRKRWESFHVMMTMIIGFLCLCFFGWLFYWYRYTRALRPPPLTVGRGRRGVSPPPRQRF